MTDSIICQHPEHIGKLCWIAVLINPSRDGIREVEDKAIQDDITICNQCEAFARIAERGFGRRAADQALMATIIKLLEQLAEKQKHLQHTADELTNSLNQLSLLKNITDTLARSDTLEKSLRIILTGATSGDAFRFNRAAVFLKNNKTNMLEGKCAIGPENIEEAGRIWENISKIPLSRLLEEILIEDEFIPCSLEMMLKRVKFPIVDGSNPLIGILHDSREKVINTTGGELKTADFSWWPLAQKIAVVPLISEGKPLGILIADNAITTMEITPDMLEALKALANACAPGLQNAILHEQLQLKIEELERMHELFKQNQAYLVRHDRLADIGTQATKVAHEFRIPLVAIGGYARRLLKTLGTDKFEPENIQVIIDEIDRLTHITEEILEYSRASKLNIRECDINNIIDESLDQLQGKLATCGVETEKHFGRKNLTVKGDPERLKQVILNLIDNAVDAMDKGGKLSIKTTRQKEYIVFDIADTGEGIDRNGLDNLFNLFYTTKNRGTGLGLPVSKKIVDDHGGCINVNSVVGSGSIFSIKLPAG